MMKVGILHQDLEWAEKEFNKVFKKMGLESNLYDVRKTNIDELSKNDFILNRVYASVANRDCKSNVYTLNLLNELKNKKIPCINSYLTTSADYSKKKSSEIMKKNQILNPETYKINSLKETNNAVDFADKYGFPIILKRDMGGRGKDVKFIENKKEFKKTLEKVFSNEDQYNQGYVVQEFLKNNRGYDCRIAIIDGEFGFSFSRSLISLNGEEPWLASTSNGSKKEKYSPSKEEIGLAIKATKSIGAIFNEVDMTFTDKGPAIIENNPTPNYVKGEDLKDKLLIAAELIKNKFICLKK